MRENKEHIAPKLDQHTYAQPPSGQGRGIVPKTDFGQELLELRQKAITDGMKVRNAAQILTEIEERRRS
jgi:hypothetical protein